VFLPPGRPKTLASDPVDCVSDHGVAGAHGRAPLPSHGAVALREERGRTLAVPSSPFLRRDAGQKQQILRPPRRTQDDGAGVPELRRLFSGGKPIIPFLTAGFPSVPVFIDAATAACDAGATALEIGMPFSDPLADGPAIQYSSQVALAGGVTLPKVLEITARLSARLPIPILLMGYLNPIMQMGFDRFACSAHDAGAAGTIIPDCPVDEAGEWRTASRRAGLANVFLIAPTTPDGRVALIDDCSTVFSYCVSVAGVTGVRRDISDSTRRFLRRVRRVAKKPYVVGFGISKPEHIRALKDLADGFVVGSALVSILRDSPRLRVAGNIGRAIAGLVRAAG